MYKVVAIGGTFDRLHKGHRNFISRAFELGRKVVIGLTSDIFVQSKFPISNFQFPIKIKKYIERKKELEKYLQAEGLFNRSKIVKIDDVYGPAVESRDIQSLVVTADTKIGAEKINRERVKRGFLPLSVKQVKMVNAQDRKPISSTRIRLGEIDRWGRVFSKLKIKSPIPDEIRMKLKKPIGVVIPGDSDDLNNIIPELKKRLMKLEPVMLITIGDEVTKIANLAGLMPDLAIIDFLVGRVQKYSDIKELYYDKFATDVLIVKNSPGNISPELINSSLKTIAQIVNDGKKRIIKVMGEEDLAGIPALLLAPLGSVILYGQPNKGVVVVEVTEEKKQELVNLLNDKRD